MTPTEQNLLNIVADKDAMILELMQHIYRNDTAIPELRDEWEKQLSRQQYEVEEVLKSFGITLEKKPIHDTYQDRYDEYNNPLTQVENPLS